MSNSQMNFQSSELPSCLGGGWVPSRLCSGPHCLQDAGGRFDAQRQVRGEEHAVGGVSCGTSVGNHGTMMFLNGMHQIGRWAWWRGRDATRYAFMLAACNGAGTSSATQLWRLPPGATPFGFQYLPNSKLG